MTTSDRIMIREVEPSDLDAFYVHQLDAEALRMAAFPSRDRAAFDAHWAKVLQAPRTVNRTIVADGQVAGYVACFPLEGNLEVAYWLGREFWGKGIATEALKRILRLVPDRPISARVTTDNVGSLKVLQKCGFAIVGKNTDFANGPGGDPEEYLLSLEARAGA